MCSATALLCQCCTNCILQQGQHCPKPYTKKHCFSSDLNKNHCFSSDLKALPGSRNTSRATCPGAEQQPGRMEPSVLPAWSQLWHTKVFKTRLERAAIVILTQCFPEQCPITSLFVLMLIFTLCEPKSRQFMLCSICTMTFYWKELETPSGQKWAQDSQHHSPLWHREQLDSLKLQFWESCWGFISTLGNAETQNTMYCTHRARREPLLCPQTPTQPVPHPPKSQPLQHPNPHLGTPLHPPKQEAGAHC